MKITFGRIFEQSLLKESKFLEDAMPFIEWVQQAVDNVARALTNSLSIQDNMDAQVLTQKVKGGTTAISIEFRTKKVPIAILMAQQVPTSPRVLSFAWQNLTNGNVQASFVFDSAPQQGVDVRFIAFFE